MSAQGTNSRELRLKLKFEQDARNSSQAFKDMAANAEKIDKHMSQAARSASQSGRGGMSPVAGGGSGGGSLAFGGGIGGIAGRAAGVAAVASTAAGLGHAVLDLDGSFTSAREKALNFARAIPLVGDSLAGLASELLRLRDRMKDPTGSMAREYNASQHPINMVRDQSAFDFDQGAGAIERKRRSLQFERDAAKQFPTASSRYDRAADLAANRQAPKSFTADEAIAAANRGENLAQGPGPMMRDDRYLAAQDAIQKAKRGLSVAQQESTAADKDLADAQKRDDLARRAEQAAAARMQRKQADEAGMGEASLYRHIRNTGGSVIKSGFLSIGGNIASAVGLADDKADKEKLRQRAIREVDPTNPANTVRDPISMAEATADAERKVAEAKRQGAAASEAAARQQEKAADLAKKQLELSRAEQELQKAKVAILGQQEQKLREQSSMAKQAAEQFGQYDSLKQQSVLDALKRFKTGGKDALSADQMDLLRGTDLTKDFVKDAAGKEVKDSKAYRDLLAQTGQKDAAQLEAEANKIAQEKVKIQSKVDVEFQLDEEKLAEKLYRIFEAGIEKALQRLRQKGNVAVDEAEVRKTSGGLQR